MSQLQIQVDNGLRFADQQLDEQAKAMLWNALFISNPEDRDEQIVLLRRAADRRLVVPRGFAVKLMNGFAKIGYDVVWDDQRVSVPAVIPAPLNNIEQLEYQMRAVQRMCHAEQGIYEAPTGSGKTITAAIVMSKIQQRTIVIVDRIEIAYQWRDRIFEALGIMASIIGDQGFDDSGDIIIALRQSLWAHRDHLDGRKWWNNFGAVFLDECHAVSAETVREIIQRFSARYRFGISATPDRHDWLTLASRSIIGEILCRTTDNELEAAGRLIKPKIVALRTPFEFQWKTLGVDTGRAWQRLLKKIKTDPARNEMIRKVLAGQRGNTMLIQTEQHAHVDILVQLAYDAGWPRECVFKLTGHTSSRDRTMIRLRAEHGDCLVVSTIGKEALDIPRLNRYMIAWPSKSQINTKQMIGRTKRVHWTKTEPPVVYDLWDHQVRPLAEQFNSRRGVYERERLELTVIG